MKKLFKVAVPVLLVSVLFLSSSFESEASTSKTTISSQSVIHTHTGTANQSTANGCYTKAKATTRQVTCTDSIKTENTNHVNDTCPNCGPQYFMVHSTHWFCPYEGWGRWTGKLEQCQKCGWVDESGSTSGTRTHTITQNVTVYELGCNKTNATVGTVSLSKTVSDKYILSIDVSGVTPVSYSWSTGSRTNTAEVTSNGNYTVSVVVKEGTVQSTKNFSYNVTDYDTTPPQISSVERFSERVANMDVVVNATDNYGVVDYKLEK